MILFFDRQGNLDRLLWSFLRFLLKSISNDDQIMIIEKTKYPVDIASNLNTDLIQPIGVCQMFKI